MTANYDEPYMSRAYGDETVPTADKVGTSPNPLTPVSVHVVKDDTKDRPREIRSAHRTFVLTAANPYIQVGGYDPARKIISINVVDTNPVVISGDISQASDTNNTAATISAPNGRLITSAMGVISIFGQDECWISAGAYPTKVGISIYREI